MSRPRSMPVDLEADMTNTGTRVVGPVQISSPHLNFQVRELR